MYIFLCYTQYCSFRDYWCSVSSAGMLRSLRAASLLFLSLFSADHYKDSKKKFLWVFRDLTDLCLHRTVLEADSSALDRQSWYK